ncbi:hypothetical protein BGZ83_004720 [Gryganskiella cystojenkinii]|nr:hypothetical protein BGZ83_004720 [Gryganskiella cystojenkinii]
MSSTLSSTLSSPSTIALETPEIVALIGEFIPLWTHLRRQDKYQFHPAALLRLGRVSKMWRQSFLPIVWRVYCSQSMSHVPFETKEQNSVYFRYFHSHHPFHSWKVTSNLIKHVSLFDWDETVFLILFKKLETLKRLDWGRVSFMQLQDELWDVFNLVSETLTTLSLYNWDIRPQQLINLLVLLPHLVSLSLTTTPLLPLSLNESMDVVRLPIQELELIEVMASMPNMECRFFQQLIECCPDLVKFVLKAVMSYTENAPEIVLDPSVVRAVALTRRHCPKLRSILLQSSPHTTVYSSQHKGDFSAKVAVDSEESEWDDQQRRGGGGGGGGGRLLQLEATIASMDATLMQMLRRDRKTLTSLKLECFKFEEAGYNADYLREIVICGDFKCLRILHFKTHYRFSQENTFALFQSRWGCVHLESLSLEGLWGTISYDKPAKIIATATAAAASIATVERHPKVQWKPMWQRTRQGKRLQVLIRQRLEDLPNLKSLSLGGVAYEQVTVQE